MYVALHIRMFSPFDPYGLRNEIKASNYWPNKEFFGHRYANSTWDTVIFTSTFRFTVGQSEEVELTLGVKTSRLVKLRPGIEGSTFVRFPFLAAQSFVKIRITKVYSLASNGFGAVEIFVVGKYSGP